MASFFTEISDKKAPGAQLTALILVILVFFLIGQSMAILLVELFFKLNFSGIGTMLRSPESYPPGPIKLLQIVASFFQFIAAAFFFSWLIKEKGFLRLNTRVNPLSILIACFMVLASIPLITFLSGINASIKLPAALSGIEHWMKTSEESIDHLVKYLLVIRQPSDLVINLVMIALIPAVGEELIFRGCLQQLMIRLFKNPHLGIWLGAIIFSALHFQFYGFFPRVFLGLLLGYLFYWSKSVWLSMAAHFFNNAMAVISSSFSKLNSKWLDSDTVQTFSWSWIVLSALLVTTGMYAIYTIYSSREEHLIT